MSPSLPPVPVGDAHCRRLRQFAGSARRCKGDARRIDDDPVGFRAITSPPPGRGALASMDAASARIYRGASWHMPLPEKRPPRPRPHPRRSLPYHAPGPCGGTGRRARLKIVFRKEWGFDSLHGHHSEFADVRGSTKLATKTTTYAVTSSPSSAKIYLKPEKVLVSMLVSTLR